MNKLLKDYNPYDSSNSLKGKGSKRKSTFAPNINEDDDEGSKKSKKGSRTKSKESKKKWQ